MRSLLKRLDAYTLIVFNPSWPAADRYRRSGGERRGSTPDRANNPDAGR
jgi:hypothetical protein